MSYLNQIVQLLSINEFIGVSENVEIAKGKYKLHYDLKGTYKQAIREFRIQRQIKNGTKKNC